MILYRSVKKQSGGEDYSATYTASVDGVLQKGSCAYMFSNNRTLNSPVIIGNNVSSCYYMFSFCTSLNQNIQISNSVTNCCGMFDNCTSLNQNIQLPDNITVCSFMFSFCTSLNQSIHIPNNAVNCALMFRSCSSFNAPISISNKVNTCGQMFTDCIAFNQDIVFPNSVNDLTYTMLNCNSFGRNIYIKGNSYRDIRTFGMMCNTNNQKRKNIFFHSTLNNLFNGVNYNSNSIFSNYLMNSGVVTWSTMTNGFYNTAYNVYCYYNYSG